MRDRQQDTRATPQPARSGWAAHSLVALERVLMGLGLLCVGLYLAACAERSLFQHTESRSFDHQLAHAIKAGAPDQSEWSKLRIERFAQMQRDPNDTGLVIGRLTIPEADLEVMVLEGSDEATLDRGVGLIEGTARPGEGGNVGIAGHRDSFFRGLRHLSPGDEILLATLEGLTRYRVSEVLVVEPQFVQVLNATPQSSLTLVTCYPFFFVGAAPQRFIVHADEVDFEEWTPVRVARFVADPQTVTP